MSRLSREKKRDQQPGATPIDVRVPLAGECATVAGTTLTATPGEELHQTVLTHLHHLARSAGHTVHATIHDARIGYVVPLEVTTDGSSRFTAEPVRMAPPEGTPSEPGTAMAFEAADRAPERDELTFPDTEDRAPFDAPRGPVLLGPPPADEPRQPAPTPDASAARPSQLAPTPDAPAAHRPQPAPTPDAAAAHPPPPLPEPVRDAPPAPPTFRLRNLSEPEPQPPSYPTDTEPSPTHVLRQLPPGPPPTQALPPAPGTVAPPMGEFGPPPVMDATPALPATPEPLPSPYGPVSVSPLPPAGFTALPTPQPLPAPQPLPSTPTPPPTPRPAPLVDPVPLLEDPDPRPAPVRGFDAVAEALMGDEAVLDQASVLAEPAGRIGEAVREGRIDAAAELAEQVVAEASGTLGPDHPDVLRVRELAAYIAYLGGEPIRATEISLDLATVQHRAGDAESAYGNMQSAATAWRAVRDPLKGLALGSDLLALWTEMAAGQGPAADEPDRLESARARMLRLAERARNANP